MIRFSVTLKPAESSKEKKEDRRAVISFAAARLQPLTGARDRAMEA